MKRIDSNQYKKKKDTVKKDFFIGTILLVLLIAGMLVFQYCKIDDVFTILVVILGFLVVFFLFIKSVYSLKVIEEENTYLTMEQYISECDNLLAKLFQLYLDDGISNHLQEFSSLISYYPFVLNEEFEFEYIDSEKEIIIRLLEDDFNLLLWYEVYTPGKKRTLIETSDPIYLCEECSLEELFQLIRKILNNDYNNH